MKSAAAIALFALSVGCSSPEAVSGYDLDDDADALDEFDSKADGDICSDYLGGALTGDELLTLVNKEANQQLRRDWYPPDLIHLPSAFVMPGKSAALRAGPREAFKVLVEAAEDEAGLILGARSGYRSFRRQCVTFAYKVATKGLEHAIQFSAEPGRSQHQLGTTVDISGPGLGWEIEPWMGDREEGKWLERNATRFGFALSYPKGWEDVTGYAYEPWHFRYIGFGAAQELEESGLVLEEYLQRCQDGDIAFLCPLEEPLAGDFGACETSEGTVGECMDMDDCADAGDTSVRGLCASPSPNIRCCISE